MLSAIENPEPWMFGVLFIWIVMVPVIVVILGRAAAQYRQKKRDQADAADIDRASNDLGEPMNRLRLQTMIRKYDLHGSVNIRDGVVLPCPNNEGVSDLVRTLNSAFYLGLPRNGNTEGMIYVERDGDTIPLNISLGDLRTIAVCMEDCK